MQTTSATVRSRYSAYALGLTNHIIDTTSTTNADRLKPRDRATWKEDLEKELKQADKFIGCNILSVGYEGPKLENKPVVKFRAMFERVEEGGRWSFDELSSFVETEDENFRYLYDGGDNLTSSGVAE